MRRARTPSRTRARGENVDSLLDTMANVVGILIVMMAVTQMTVNDAMKRIQVWESEAAVSLRERRENAEEERARSAGIDLSRTLELARLREHIERVRETKTVADTATVSAKVASQRLRVRRLEAKIADKREQLANLQILLDESESRTEQQGIALRLPDPRPAPAGSNRLVFFARYGRAFDPRFDQLTRELNDVMAQTRGPLPRYFDAYDVGNEMLRWRILEEPRGRVHRLKWRRTDIGESPDELQRPGSALRASLDAYDKSERYLHFFVWGDSFEAYLEARRVAEEAGYKVGWEAIPIGKSLDLVIDRGPLAPVD